MFRAIELICYEANNPFTIPKLKSYGQQQSGYVYYDQQ